MNDINIFNLCKSGIYEIRCLKNNKVYIGQSENCAYRIGRHFNDLKKKIHHCEPLLEDFLKYGIDSFQAVVILDIPKDGILNKKSREKLEAKLLSELEPLEYYNITSTNETPSYKSYRYQDKTFNTIKELREFINITRVSPYSETHFKRLFLNKNSPNRHEIEYIGQKPQTVVFSIEGKNFNGWKEVVNSGLANTKSQVFYRLNSSNYNTWFRLKTKKYKDFKNKLSNGYLINDIYYKSADKVVEAGLAEDINKVYYRVSSLSSKWKTWKRIK